MRIVTLLSTIFYLLFSLQVVAQITLTTDDVPEVGDSIIIGTTTITEGVSPGAPGDTAQEWDFAFLQAEETYTNVFLDPSQGPDSDSFPEADFVLFSNDIYSFADLTPDALYLLGGSVPEAAQFGISSLRLDTPQQLFAFPSTYGTTFNSNYSIDVTVDGSIINPLVDSVRLKQSNMATVEIDAFGTVTTPLGTVEALRQRTDLVTIDSVYFLAFGSWGLFDATTTLLTKYSWLAAETRGEILSINVDEAGDVQSVDFVVGLNLTGMTAPIAGFSYEVTPNGAFQFIDQSQNGPETWSWDFGDGAVSTEQNPLHTYAAGGSYEVCLTVTNAIGSNTHCRTVMPAIAPVAAFTFTDQGGGQFDFMDQSANEPQSWLWNFGDGATSTDQNPSHTFAADDTYNVCLTVGNPGGVDQACQMVAVTISALDDRFGKVELIVTPNPMRDQLQFRLNNYRHERFEVQLLDAGGQVLLNGILQGQLELETQSLPAGAYVYRLLNGGKIVAAGKVMKVE